MPNTNKEDDATVIVNVGNGRDRNNTNIKYQSIKTS